MTTATDSTPAIITDAQVNEVIASLRRIRNWTTFIGAMLLIFTVLSIIGGIIVAVHVHDANLAQTCMSLGGGNPNC